MAWIMQHITCMINPGGAWLEDASGSRNWFGFATIEKELGRIWLDDGLLDRRGSRFARLIVAR